MEWKIPLQILLRVAGRILQSRTRHFRPSTGISKGAGETTLERHELILVLTEQAPASKKPEARVASAPRTLTDCSESVAATKDSTTFHQPAYYGNARSIHVWPLTVAAIAAVVVETATSLLNESVLPQSPNDARKQSAWNAVLGDCAAIDAAQYFGAVARTTKRWYEWCHQH